MKWYPFDPARGSRQKRPPERKAVLVIIDVTGDYSRAIAVGYMKNAAGDKQSPHFVIPGVGGKALAWCDCLTETDIAKLWRDADSLPDR